MKKAQFLPLSFQCNKETHTYCSVIIYLSYIIKLCRLYCNTERAQLFLLGGLEKNVLFDLDLEQSPRLTVKGHFWQRKFSVNENMELWVRRACSNSEMYNHFYAFPKDSVLEEENQLHLLVLLSYWCYYFFFFSIELHFNQSFIINVYP